MPVITDRDAIDLLSWKALRGALHLEIVTGLRMSSRRSAAQIARQRLNVTTRRRRALLYELDLRIEELERAYLSRRANGTPHAQPVD